MLLSHDGKQHTLQTVHMITVKRTAFSELCYTTALSVLQQSMAMVVL
jgi:hypothetical protein